MGSKRIWKQIFENMKATSLNKGCDSKCDGFDSSLGTNSPLPTQLLKFSYNLYPKKMASISQRTY